MERTSKHGRDPVSKLKRRRNPGESTYERLESLLLEKVLLWIMMCATLVGFVWMEFWRWYFPAKPTPFFTLFIAIIVWGVAGYKMFRLWPELKAIRQGAVGERRVGHLLDGLREMGYHVFHDVDADGKGNIDHVLIGPAGVFAIETKTISLPSDRKAIVTFDGQTLLVDGRNPAEFGGRNPVDQVLASASCLVRIISDCTGEKIQVRPVLTYPGWWVEASQDCWIWVMNPEQIAGRLNKLEDVLTEKQVRQIANNFARLVDRELDN